MVTWDLLFLESWENTALQLKMLSGQSHEFSVIIIWSFIINMFTRQILFQSLF